jgi:hypothetical protein
MNNNKYLTSCEIEEICHPKQSISYVRHMERTLYEQFVYEWHKRFLPGDTMWKTMNDLAVRTGRNVEKERTFLEIERCICFRVIAVDLKLDQEFKAFIRKWQV